MIQLKRLPSKLPIGRGFLKGRMVRFTEREGLRPTPARVREAIFSMIADYTESHGFIDACAGSGVMGFLAASCGFQPVLVVETQRDTFAELEANNAELGTPVTLCFQNVMQVSRLPLEHRAWLCFADPPFKEHKFHVKLMGKLAALEAYALGSLYMAEHEVGFQPPEGYALVKDKKYGRTLISLFEKTAHVARQTGEAESEPEEAVEPQKPAATSKWKRSHPSK